MLMPEIGEYFVLSLGFAYPVAISTLRDEELAETLATMKPDGLSIVGKTHTENIGIEKVIKTLLFVPSIRYLILCGQESGHYSGDTLKSLMQNGVDKDMRVKGSKAKRPVLVNSTLDQIEAFREQIEIVDMVGCNELTSILEKLTEVSQKASFKTHSADRSSVRERTAIVSTPEVVTVTARDKDPRSVKQDSAGYFVIVPKESVIFVEHYGNDNRLLHIVKGVDARSLYWTIIENGWVTELSHAAYLGKELAKAELSIMRRVKYIQDKA